MYKVKVLHNGWIYVPGKVKILKPRIFTIRVNLQSFVKYFYQVQDQLQAFQESEADEILEMVAIYTGRYQN